MRYFKIYKILYKWNNQCIKYTEFIADDKYLKELNENWNTIAPYFLDFYYTIPKKKQVKTAELIRKHYFGSKQINKTTVEFLIQMAGDRFFTVDSIKAAKVQAKVNQQPVWYYYYTYRGAHSLSECFTKSNENFGKKNENRISIVKIFSYDMLFTLFTFFL